MDPKSKLKFVEDDQLIKHGNKSRLLSLSWGTNKENGHLIYQKDGSGPKLIKLYLDRILNPEVLNLNPDIAKLKDRDKVYCPQSKKLLGEIYTNNSGRKVIKLEDSGEFIEIKELGINYTPSRNKVLQQLIWELKLPKIDKRDKSIIGISGSSGAGKTTLTDELAQELTNQGYNAIVINQDDFRIAKKERYKEDGSQKQKKLPLTNLWHHWGDMVELITEIKESTNSKTISARVYNKKDSNRSTTKNFQVRGRGDIILVEGMLIFDLGEENKYNISPDSIRKLLDHKIFVFRKTKNINKDTILQLIHQRECSQNPDKSDKQNFKKAQKLFDIFIKDIEAAHVSWRKYTNILFDNADFHHPKFTLK